MQTGRLIDGGRAEGAGAANARVTRIDTGAPRSGAAVPAGAQPRCGVRRLGRPGDMAAWLASDGLDLASGQVFRLNGGLTAALPLNPGGS